jgi:hypothetical protein
MAVTSKSAGKKKAEENQLKKIAVKAKTQAKEAKKATKKAASPAAKKKAAEATTRPTTAKATGQMIEPEAKKATEEPPHRHSVHIKKNELTVIVTLTKIPAQHINIEETTDGRLVVDTSKHTKKYRLEFPFPSGMKVDAEKGEYEFQHGQLTCVFAVTHMPKAVAQSVENRLNSVRKSQKMRFEADKDGDMIVRSRRTQMSRTGALTTDAAKKAKAEEQKGEVVDGAGLDDAVKRAAGAKGAKGAAPKDGAAAAAGDDKGKKAKKEAAAGKAGKKAKAPDAMAEEKARMLALAADVATKSDQSLKAKLAKARDLHASRIARTAASSEKKGAKTEKMQFAFERIVSEKQKRLAAAEEAQRVPAKKANKGKAVKFA